MNNELAHKRGQRNVNAPSISLSYGVTLQIRRVQERIVVLDHSPRPW